MINLDKMFNSCNVKESYIRINPKYLNDIYLGYNEDGLKTLVVVGKSKQKEIKSTNSINVAISKRMDGRVNLGFSLYEDKYSSVFYKFCEDIIENSIKVPTERVIVHTIKRWGVWKALFDKPIKGKLSKEQVKGLIGELMFLKHYLIDKYGQDRAIDCWVGPDNNPKDFWIDDLWYELKAVNESKQSVAISSLEQLDSDHLGYMVVNKFQATSNQYKDHININTLISHLAITIENPDVLETLMLKLFKSGYEYNVEYDEICFEYKRTTFYKIDNEFPILRRNKLPTDILKVSYELSLVNLDKERVVKWI